MALFVESRISTAMDHLRYAIGLVEDAIRRGGVVLPWMQNADDLKAIELSYLPQREQEARERGARCPKCNTVPGAWRALSGGVMMCGGCKRTSPLNDLVYTIG